MKKKSLRPAGDLVNGFLIRSGFGAHAADVRLVRRWTMLVGPVFARNVRPAFSKDGTLFLDARTDAWAQETRNLDQTLLAKIREAGAGEFKYLKVRTNRWSERKAGSSSGSRKFPVPPEGALPEEIEKRTGKIEDPALRDAIRSFLFYHDDPGGPGGKAGE